MPQNNYQYEYWHLIILCNNNATMRQKLMLLVVVVVFFVVGIVVILTLARRRTLVRDHKTDSNNSGVEEHPRKKYTKAYVHITKAKRVQHNSSAKKTTTQQRCPGEQTVHCRS